jgi:hypothetical protein
MAAPVLPFAPSLASLAAMTDLENRVLFVMASGGEASSLYWINCDPRQSVQTQPSVIQVGGNGGP